MILLLPFLMITGSLGSMTFDDTCQQLYTECLQKAHNMGTSDRCRYVKTLMICLNDATTQCYPEFLGIVKGYQDLVDEGCRPYSNLMNDVITTGHCIAIHNRSYEHCKLEGEFETAADLCSSFSGLLGCYASVTQEKCGESDRQVLQKVLKPITDSTETCQNSQSMKENILSECYGGILKCDRHIFNKQRYGCVELEKNARCYLEVLKNCDTSHPYKIIEKYLAQIPDYCNPESEFRRNFDKSIPCITTKFPVTVACREEHLEDLQRALNEVQEHRNTNKIMAEVAKINRELYHCIARNLGSACGKEAAFVAQYVLGPLVEMSEDAYEQYTGEKLNSAGGLKCSSVLLILSFAYILTKRNE